MTMPGRTWRVLSVLLVIVNVGLAGVIVYVVRRGSGIETILAAKPRSIDIPVLPAAHTRSGEDWGALQQQAVFHSARRFFEAPTPEENVLPVPNYRLAGVFLLPRKPTVAVLTPTAGGASRRIKAGEDLDGWLVRAVELHKISLEHGVQRAEIVDGRPVAASGLHKTPLNRTAANSGGIRVLGGASRYVGPAVAGDAMTASMPINRPISEPRLYRPPQP